VGLAVLMVSAVVWSCAAKRQAPAAVSRTHARPATTVATTRTAARYTDTADAEAAARSAMDPLIPTPHPVPLLTPQEEIKTFNLPDGFHAEVVACEPMVQHPIFATFDPDGRLWVVEMRGYMPNIEGKGENEPVGRI